MTGRAIHLCRSLYLVWCLWIGLPGCDRVNAPQPAPVAQDVDRQKHSHSAKPAVTETPVEVPASHVASPQVPPQSAYRPADQRLRHDEARLKAAGISLVESKRLKLYTDIPLESACDLPDLVDQIYPVWESALGSLPPDRAGTDFQMSGYLIRDLALFRELGLVPEELNFEHGRHVRNEFWMREQATDYYRRHLLLHEATHCFMMYWAEINAPIWYLEGMAEYFAAHRIDDQRRAHFRVMPTSARDFAGFGRILTIHDSVVAGRLKSISEILAFEPHDFRSNDCYAWSWALCAFLDGTPSYQARFRQLNELIHGNQFRPTAIEFFGPQQRELATEWSLFLHHLQDGYDLTRAAIEFQPGLPFSTTETERLARVQADRGWQSSQVQLEAGQRYTVTATGQFTLADTPKPWLSEPQGVTIRYFGGHPIGMLVGCIHPDEGPAGGNDEPMLRVIPLGRESQFESPVTGTLYLRLNDAWNSLADNRGQVDVTIRHVTMP
ncbi:hypothetical protein [Schlesneria paludicola]|uniref:hypothetical protein n=1 Tax=Schlesneria paludicola TaxID=360056 RepID=UPI00029B3AC8|nr:hypothetical protein [Schlesneria paludicola]